MNSYSISYDDLSAMLSIIGYFHSKIREGSMILGENFDLISEELISEIAEFLEVENDQHQPAWLKPAA